MIDLSILIPDSINSDSSLMLPSYEQVDTDVNAELLIDTYEQLLVKCISSRYSSASAENIRSRISKCLDWLRSTDFYTCPASTQYHESCPSGLLKHSLNVYNRVIDLCTTKVFSTVDKHSAVLIALTHDWCKIGLYEMYYRNVKNESTGKWEQVPSYKHNQKSVPLGHGVSSMFLLSRFVMLHPDEALAIRWHMGAWRVCDSEMNELQMANETCPLVHLIQFADQLSIVNY